MLVVKGIESYLRVVYNGKKYMLPGEIVAGVFLISKQKTHKMYQISNKEMQGLIDALEQVMLKSNQTVRFV